MIELLVVISIIALLAAIILASVGVARAKSRDARRISDLHSIQVALEEYYADHGSYPLADTSDYQTAFSTNYNGCASSPYKCGVMTAITVFSVNSNYISSWAVDGPNSAGCPTANGNGLVGCTNASTNWATLATSLSKYIVLPIDPVNNTNAPTDETGGGDAGFGVYISAAGFPPEYNYSYSVTGDGQHYELFAQLEKANTIDCGNNTASYLEPNTNTTGPGGSKNPSGFFDAIWQQIGGVAANNTGSLYDYCYTQAAVQPHVQVVADMGWDNQSPTVLWSPLIYGVYNH